MSVIYILASVVFLLCLVNWARRKPPVYKIKRVQEIDLPDGTQQFGIEVEHNVFYCREFKGLNKK